MYEKLGDIFNAVAVKNLKAVDVPRGNSRSKGSNQHEIGGLVKVGFAEYLGRPENGEVLQYSATMIYITDEDAEPNICEDHVSWYDARHGQSARGPEYRLYYKTNEVTQFLREDDFFLIALTKENTLFMIFSPQDSQAQQQLKVLFAAVNVAIDATLKKVSIKDSDLVLPIRTLLAQLGIELFSVRKDDNDKLNIILETFGSSFPKTKEFSIFARNHTSELVCAINDPDGALITWFDEEEHLFRLLERHIVANRLRQGFGEQGDDVDAFIKFSLGVQNRRKSRAGHAFENHIAEILTLNKVDFEAGVYTEGKQKPDFLFPSKSCYDDSSFDTSKLRMLGAKTSCKERWRQVLVEAIKIKNKHLITLEPAISEEQTNQMNELSLQLVVPQAIQKTYSKRQLQSIISFEDFISEVKGI